MTSATPGAAPRRGPRPDPQAVVGDAVVVRSLRRDALGEVCVARRGDTDVRLRLHDTGAVVAAAGRLRRAAAVRHPALALQLGRFSDGRRRVAVLSPLDELTLAERSRLGRLDAVTGVALGATLVEGLQALHAAGLAHGAAGAAAVGIGAGGRPRWQDAALAAPPADGGETEDVAGLARALRDVVDLPDLLARMVDDAASGTAAAPISLAAFAAAWRQGADARGLPLPPRGAEVVLPALLPAARPPRRRRRRLRLPRPARLTLAALVALSALAVVPAARVMPGGAPPTGDLADYRPAHAGQALTYTVTQRTRTGSATSAVRLRVGDDAVVAGVPTLTLVPDGMPPPGLPLGLDGTTLRVQDGALVRSTSGGAVRDLLAPLRPGTAWSDSRPASGGFVTEERRTVLGVMPLGVPGSGGSACLAVDLDVASRAPAAGTAGQAAHGTLWYCPGVGLARAELAGADETDSVVLVSSSSG